MKGKVFTCGIKEGVRLPNNRLKWWSVSFFKPDKGGEVAWGLRIMIPIGKFTIIIPRLRYKEPA